ncbi:hypothetical protein PCE1_002946 [Barthelona sp. PCE]
MKEWNNSTKVEYKAGNRAHATRCCTLSEGKNKVPQAEMLRDFNFRAEQLPDVHRPDDELMLTLQKSGFKTLPNNPKLADKEEFNLHTATIDRKGLEQRTLEMTKESKKKNKPYNNSVRRTSLMNREKQFESTLRECRLLDKQMVSINDMKLAELEAQVDMDLKTMRLELRQQLSRTKGKPNVTYEHYHTGVFEQTPFEDEPTWSCCMKFGEDAKGCQRKKLNRDRWSLTSCVPSLSS